jgi:hypothetical protein
MMKIMSNGSRRDWHGHGLAAWGLWQGRRARMHVGDRAPALSAWWAFGFVFYCCLLTASTNAFPGQGGLPRQV